MKTVFNSGKQAVLLCLLLLSGVYCYSQSEIDKVNLELIPYSSVKTYLENQQARNVKTFLDIKPTWSGNKEGYNVQEKTYKVKGDLTEVWDYYKTTSPSVSWNGKKVMFGFMYSKEQNKPVYRGELISEIDTGQVIFLNLKLLKFYNLAMAFEVIAVDAEKKIIEFSYIEGNASQGKQSLQFVDTPKGYTEIVHRSYFKSGSKLRDKILYPFFHTRTTNEFHRIMRKIICKN